MTKKIGYIIIAFLSAPVLFFLIRSLFIPSVNCMLYEGFTKEDYSGIIIEKYIDKNNHANSTLKISRNGIVSKLVLHRDTIFFNYVNVTDSLIKKPNQKNIIVVRDTINREFEIDFGCEE